MPAEVAMPRLGWTMEEGLLVAWLKQDGDTVEAGEPLFTVEGDKALVEVEAFDSGILHIPPDSPPIGSTVLVGARLAYLLAPGEALPTNPAMEPPAALEAATAPEVRSQMPARASRRPAVSPRARRAADELGVDWKRLTGSGRSGRIVERDVRAAAPPASPAPLPAASLTSRRRLIADRMLASSQASAPVTLTTEIDASELVRLRAQLKDEAVAPVPSYTHLFMKICALALVEHPALNASLSNGQIVEHASVNIGVAVDAERGLLVPVVFDVQAKSLRAIAAEATGLVERARAGSAAPDELRGGTFTITNLGAYEIDAFTPILNLPECAILGLGRILPKVVVVDAAAERTAIRHRQVLSLTFDHRLVDGGPAARFLQRVTHLAERPFVWLVG